MSAPQNVIAVIFDFDDTLTDDSTTKLLEEYGVDPKEFWQIKNKALVDQGWDPTLSYLHLLLEHVGDTRAFGKLSNAQLREFGATLEFYPGIPELFDDLSLITEGHRLSRPSVEFYVISGGLEEIIAGSSIARHLSGFRGCRFDEDEACGIFRVRNTVSFTEKTRYIFEISKGLMAPGADTRKRPYDVNNLVRDEDRRVPLKNMIYVGDGLTDVPCFSLIDKGGGYPFGVFDPKKEDSPKRALENLLAPRRVKTMNSPNYGKCDDLGSILRGAVKRLCLDFDVNSRTVSRQ
jgi:phosphoserine phosphatase